MIGASGLPRIRLVAVSSARGGSISSSHSSASRRGPTKSPQAVYGASLSRSSLIRSATSWRGAPRRRAWFSAYQLVTSSRVAGAADAEISSKRASAVVPRSAAATSITWRRTRSRAAFSRIVKSSLSDCRSNSSRNCSCMCAWSSAWVTSRPSRTSTIVSSPSRAAVDALAVLASLPGSPRAPRAPQPVRQNENPARSIHAKAGARARGVKAVRSVAGAPGSVEQKVAEDEVVGMLMSVMRGEYSNPRRLARFGTAP